jgi:8-oxo-dGTP pyrophosphatase MutT (NUDIX family)
MRERITVRVLLFDPDGQILLMKGRMTYRSTDLGAWFTVGGGADPGETQEDCARREVMEESGFTEVTLGPAVWRRTAPGILADGERVLLVETYMVAWVPGGEPVRDHWEAHEHDLVDDLRWWTLEDLAACEEQIFPERFLELLPDVAAGRYPETVLDITVR